MSPRRAAIALALTLSALPGHALADKPPSEFRFERMIMPSGAGPLRVDVDVPLLSGAEPGAGLRDLRLSTETGTEVPYILVEPSRASPETWLSGTLLTIPSHPNESGFEVDLRRVAHVDRLRLEGLPRPLLKQARVEGSGDRSHYTVLVPQVTVFDLPDEKLVDLDIPLPDGEERYLRVTWDDHATSPIPPPTSVVAREVVATTAPEPLRADVPFERRPSRAGESRFRVHLPAAGLPVVALELSCGGGHLLRVAKVSEPELRGDEVVPAERGTATLRRSTRDGLRASALRIPVAHVRGKDLDLSVDDGDNPPLDVQGVSAVFAPQPWIYVESPAPGPLLARYGDPKASRPRYDLEAARAGLSKLHPASASWGAPKPLAPAPHIEPPPEIALAGAPLDTAGFLHTRAILPGTGNHAPAGLGAVALDVAVLAHSASLTDLRIRDASGHQVPYLLEHRDEATLVDLTLSPVTADVPAGPRVTPKTSLYRLELPYASLPAGRLVLRTDAHVFQRRVRLLVPRAANASVRDAEVRTLVARDWGHADADTPAPPLVIPWNERETAVVYVQVDEGDNAPLALSGARLELSGARLRFFHAADPALTLLYGDATLAAPRYDLALLAPTLAGVVSDELTLGSETSTTPPTPPAQSGLPVFWVVLVVAVLVLLALMGVLLRKPPEETAEPKA